MNYLSLDYGTSHIGVALATGPLAQPLTTISTSKFAGKLPELIKKHNINGLVVGDAPLDFIQNLKSLNLRVYQVDETLTSHDARQSLLHTSQTKRRQVEHSAAAAIILQNWLDSRNQN